MNGNGNGNGNGVWAKWVVGVLTVVFLAWAGIVFHATQAAASKLNDVHIYVTENVSALRTKQVELEARLGRHVSVPAHTSDATALALDKVRKELQQVGERQSVIEAGVANLNTSMHRRRFLP